MKQKILILYFSHSGNTFKVAKAIQEQTGGTLCELKPKQPYPAAYNTIVEQAKKEISTGFLPDLYPIKEDVKNYDVIFVGTPNWWSTIAPPIAAFLSSHDLSEKTVVPFCTHGGGGIAQVASDIAKLCPYSSVLNSLQVYSNGGSGLQKNIADWLEKIGIPSKEE